jgi:hypothetical protein
MPAMDIFLTADGFRTLGAVRRLAPAGGSRGFLLGHRRGNRMYVEKALPSPRPAWPSLESFYALDAEMGKKIIGFYVFRPSALARKPLLRPFGTGKILVEISGPSGKKPSLAGAVIEYDGRFLLRKIPLIVEAPAG